MNGRTRLHRSQKGIAVNDRTRIEGVVARIGSRGQDTGYRFCDARHHNGGLEICFNFNVGYHDVFGHSSSLYE